MFSSSTKIFTKLCYLNKNLSKILCSLASLPVRGAWIEITFRAGLGWLGKSLPVRGAWIEIDRNPLRAPLGKSRSP